MRKPDATQRFSNRVENYVRYRPRYPSQILEVLQAECGLTAASEIGDIGSGTGFLGELFLANGNRVFGIEPNREMRQAGERLLDSYQRFVSLAGTAEDTGLPSYSVDFVTAGQAFHWFDRESCREEFRRILRPGGWVVLVWNDRRADSTPFLAGYERLLRTFGTDYAQVDHRQVDVAALRQFFGTEPCSRVFPNYQQFDLASLKGRLLSSSYVPEAGQPGHEKMLDALEDLFEAHQQDRQVAFQYDCRIYYGRLISSTDSPR